MQKLSRRAGVGVRSRGCLLLRVTRQFVYPGGGGSPVLLCLKLILCLANVRRRDPRLLPESERGNYVFPGTSVFHNARVSKRHFWKVIFHPTSRVGIVWSDQD